MGCYSYCSNQTVVLMVTPGGVTDACGDVDWVVITARFLAVGKQNNSGFLIIATL